MLQRFLSCYPSVSTLLQSTELCSQLCGCDRTVHRCTNRHRNSQHHRIQRYTWPVRKNPCPWWSLTQLLVCAIEKQGGPLTWQLRICGSTPYKSLSVKWSFDAIIFSHYTNAKLLTRWSVVGNYEDCNTMLSKWWLRPLTTWIVWSLGQEEPRIVKWMRNF